MSDEELFFSIFAMTVTGSDTVPLSTAASVYYLARHPDQMQAVRADRSLIAHAFEEAARFDQPTNVLGRTVVKDIQIYDKTLTPGQKVLFLYASATRDEREFERADEFLILRDGRNARCRSASAPTSALASTWPGSRGGSSWKSCSRPCPNWSSIRPAARGSTANSCKVSTICRSRCAADRTSSP